METREAVSRRLLKISSHLSRILLEKASGLGPLGPVAKIAG